MVHLFLKNLKVVLSNIVALQYTVIALSFAHNKRNFVGSPVAPLLQNVFIHMCLKKLHHVKISVSCIMPQLG